VSRWRELPTAAETQAFGRALGERLRGGDLVVLTGDLGAGKTTLTQGLAEGLGVRGPITSPTFVIARVHPSLVGGPSLVHVDAYRLGGGAELDDLDLDADLDEAVTVVEWGAGLVEQLTEDRLEVLLERSGTDDPGEQARRVGLRGVGLRWDDVMYLLQDPAL
jgi:tRNA threonylcarbamoyladenosine biosynthesis protein TsaE